MRQENAEGNQRKTRQTHTAFLDAPKCITSRRPRPAKRSKDTIPFPRTNLCRIYAAQHCLPALPLHVPQKRAPQADPLVRSLEQPRDVGKDHSLPVEA